MIKQTAIAMALLLCMLQATLSYANSGEVHFARSMQEQELIISLDDLVCEGHDLFVQLEGTLYPLKSLEKSGSSWLAKVDSHNEYCRAGHQVCRLCWQCHITKCYYYVPPCSGR